MPVQINPLLTYDTGYPDKFLVMTGDQFQEMLNFLDDSRFLVFDFETTGLRWFQGAQSVGLALAGRSRSGEVRHFYVPYRHKTGEAQLELQIISPAIKSLLENPTTLKIAHNLKFDEHFAHLEDWHVLGPRYDTMLAARFFDENKSMALKFRAGSDLGRSDADQWETRVAQEIKKLVKIHRMKKSEYMAQYGYSQVAIPICGTYACFDVDFTFELLKFYEKAGISTEYPGLWDNEMALVGVLCQMEENGLLVDVPHLEKLRLELIEVQSQLELRIEQYMGRRLELSRDEEIRNLLLNQLGIPLSKQTKKGALAVDHEVLEELQDQHPVIPLIMRWREVEKIRGTYITSILDRIDSKNILHADFQQAGTNTGRLSCREPNFQNQPSDNNDRAKEFSGKSLEDGGVDPWSIRRAYINRGKGWMRQFWDYSQIELRVIAFYTQDPVMVDAYIKGEDIHSRTSMEVFGTKEKAKRRISKVINFGLAYGMSEIGLSRQVKIPIEDAEKFLARFYDRYAGVAKFKSRFWGEVRQRGGTFRNIFGRPRRVPEINSWDNKLRGRAERQAIATLIQGTAAELTKISLVRISELIQEHGFSAQIVNTVHDEIQIDVPVEEMVEFARGVKKLMEHFPQFAPIPIVVDGEYTVESWADKKPLPEV